MESREEWTIYRRDDSSWIRKDEFESESAAREECYKLVRMFPHIDFKVCHTILCEEVVYSSNGT